MSNVTVLLSSEGLVHSFCTLSICISSFLIFESTCDSIIIVIFFSNGGTSIFNPEKETCRMKGEYLPFGVPFVDIIHTLQGFILSQA